MVGQEARTGSRLPRSSRLSHVRRSGLSNVRRLRRARGGPRGGSGCAAEDRSLGARGSSSSKCSSKAGGGALLRSAAASRPSSFQSSATHLILLPIMELVSSAMAAASSRAGARLHSSLSLSPPGRGTASSSSLGRGKRRSSAASVRNTGTGVCAWRRRASSFPLYAGSSGGFAIGAFLGSWAGEHAPSPPKSERNPRKAR